MVFCEEKLVKTKNWVYRDPTKLIRCTILFICCIVVIVEISQCYSKLRNPPITTHSQSHLNDTMYMPAVTICREPPYKSEILEKYNLTEHPKITSSWRQFPFDEHSIEDVFNEAVYTQKEILSQYGLNGYPEMINIISHLQFNLGNCLTFLPQGPLKSTFQDHGYSILLKHDIWQNESILRYPTPGWHVYVHEPRENFTELKMKTATPVDYVFLGVEEEIELKLQTEQFSILPSEHDDCIPSHQYSAPKCGELCIWREVISSAGCKGPWMHHLHSPLEMCSNYSTISKLITDYEIIYDEEIEPQCYCPRICDFTVYTTHIQNRKSFTQQLVPMTQIWIYYTSKLVSKIEEKHGYDMYQFIADIGGSLGFLLGLSVLGLINMIEKIVILLFGSLILKMKENVKNNDKSGEERSKSSTGEDDDAENFSDTTIQIDQRDEKL